jgi:hypothetical protein
MEVKITMESEDSSSQFWNRIPLNIMQQYLTGGFTVVGIVAEVKLGICQINTCVLSNFTISMNMHILWGYPIFCVNFKHMQDV